MAVGGDSEMRQDKTKRDDEREKEMTREGKRRP
jgi:hypothetical protein